MKKVTHAMALAVLLLAAAPSALAQTGPPPALDYGDTEKSVVVRFSFMGPQVAEVSSAEVFWGHAPARLGAPPVLQIKVRRLDAGIIEEFGAWHPLWDFGEGDAGTDGRIVRAQGTISVIVPFSPDAAVLEVADGGTETPIVSADLLPYTHGYCRENPADSDCASLANRAPSCSANGPYVAECTGSATSVALDGSASSDPDGDPLAVAWTGAFGTAEGPAPTVEILGLGVSAVGLRVSDAFGGSSTCGSTVEIVDTLPPVIDHVAAQPALLWAPDNKMYPVAVAVAASDTCAGPVGCQVVSVTSNEPPDSDAVASGDAVVAGPLTLTLRAQRHGTGTDRVYTIAVQCTDGPGNARVGTATVTVPHDVGR